MQIYDHGNVLLSLTAFSSNVKCKEFKYIIGPPKVRAPTRFPERAPREKIFENITSQ